MAARRMVLRRSFILQPRYSWVVRLRRGPPFERGLDSRWCALKTDLKSTLKSGGMSQTVLLTGVDRRRRWSDANRRRILEEAFSPGAVISQVARRHDVSTGAALYVAASDGGSSARACVPACGYHRGAGCGHRGPPCCYGGVGTERAGPHRGLGAGSDHRGDFAGAAMIPMSSTVRVWIATGHTDMRRGMHGLALQVQEGLKRDPHAGDLYIFRGRRGDLVKILWHDGIGLIGLRQAA